MAQHFDSLRRQKMDSIIQFVVEQTPAAVYQNLIWLALVALVSAIGVRTWRRRHDQPFEDWKLLLFNAKGEEEYQEEISREEMQKYLRDPHQLRLFLKSHAANLNFFLTKDIIHWGIPQGATVVDRAAKRIVHDLSKYPQSAPRPAPKALTEADIAAAVEAVLMKHGLIKTAE